MGEGLIYFYKNKIRKEHKLSFVITFIFTLLIHAYKFANYLPIADSLHFNYSSSDIIQSGRWFLSIACSISSYFDLPWVLGILSCIYIAVTTVIIVSLFKVKNPIIIILISGLFASSTCTTDTIMYLYTADGYFLSMLLATLAVYLTRIEKKRIFPKLIAIILLCLSCGIYQAYITFAILLIICEFIMLLLDDKYSTKEIFFWLLKLILINVIALTIYYVIWQYALYIKNLKPSNHLGISEVGTFSIMNLEHGLYNTFLTFMNFFLLMGVNEIEIVPYNFLNIVFLIVAIITILITILRKKIYKNFIKLLLITVSLLLIIPCSSFWHFTSLSLFSISYFPKMLHSITIIYILIILLCEKYTFNFLKNFVAILITIICFYNSIMANITYFYMEKSYFRTMDDASKMMEKIN